MNRTFSLLFYLKKSKTNPNTGLTPIYLRITIDGKRSEISINRSIEASRWNSASAKAIGTTEGARTLNAYIESLRARIYNQHRALVDSDSEITSNALKNTFLGISERERTLCELLDSHNARVKTLIGLEYSVSTYKKYLTATSHIKQYIRWKYNTSDINIKNINHEFVTDFDLFMRSNLRLSNNSTLKYMKNFKKIIRIALNNDWITKDPFTNYKGKFHEIEKPYLTKEELEALTTKAIPNLRLSLVKDIFVFACYTGLSYSDVEKLSSENITKGIDKQDWIIVDRTKTKARCRIPLFDIPKSIIDKYKDYPSSNNKGTLLPILSNQKMNAYLKEIADITGIEKNLTFHVARHTFATTVLLSNNVPLESVSSMLGHSTTIMTQHYAKIVDTKISKDTEHLRNVK